MNLILAQATTSSLSSVGLSQAMQLNTAMVPVAYLLCVLGLFVSVLRNSQNFHQILMTIVGILVIVILINGYPTALQTVATDFQQLRQQIAQNYTWQNIFKVNLDKPGLADIPGALEMALCKLLMSVGQVSVFFLNWVQSFAIVGLIAISPLLLGMLATPWTQGAGITFLMTSFGVAMWHFGIALVDLLLAQIAPQIFAAAGLGAAGVSVLAAGSIIVVADFPILLGALLAIILIALAMYLAVPLVIAAVLKGGSPLTTAAMAGMQMAGTGAGLSAMIGSQIAARMGGGAAGGGGEQLSKALGDLTKAIGTMNGGGGGTSGAGSVAHSLRPGGGGAGLGGAPESSLVSSDEAPRNVRSSTGYGTGGAQSQSPAQRQASILASYSGDPGSSAPPPAANQLAQRKAEAAQILEKRDKNYT